MYQINVCGIKTKIINILWEYEWVPLNAAVALDCEQKNKYRQK